MSQMLSQGSQNSASSNRSRRSTSSAAGGSAKKLFASPFAKKGKPRSLKASNKLRVWHIVPDRTREGPGRISSGVIVSCDGQFEHKMISMLFQRQEPPFQQWMDDIGVLPRVLTLGRRDSPMRQGNWDKRGCLWIHPHDAENDCMTREEVQDFVVNVLVPSVQQVNPCDPGREPVWDPNDTYQEITAYDRIVNDREIASIANLHYVSDNDSFPTITTNSHFWKFSKKMLYSFFTPGLITDAFKELHALQNIHMLPADHHQDDNQDQLNQVAAGGGNNGGPPIQIQPILFMPPPGGNQGDNAPGAAAQAGNNAGQDNANPNPPLAIVNQVANNDDNNDPLVDDDILDSDDDENNEPPNRRRRLNQD